MLVRLMYASRAAAGLDNEEVSAILRQSRAANARDGLTGALCMCTAGHLFIQVLEGGRDAVSRRFNRIACDPRHSDVTLLSFEEIEERRFAGWAMGRVDMQRLNPALLHDSPQAVKLKPALNSWIEAEPRIGFARQTFNEAVQVYNHALHQWPTRLITTVFGFAGAGRA